MDTANRVKSVSTFLFWPRGNRFSTGRSVQIIYKEGSGLNLGWPLAGKRPFNLTRRLQNANRETPSDSQNDELAPVSLISPPVRGSCFHAIYFTRFVSQRDRGE